MEGIGFGMGIMAIWFDDLLGWPARFMGVTKNPFYLVDDIATTIWLLVLGTLVIVFTRRLLNKIKRLEGFLPVCAFCKRIRVADKWIPIETYIRNHADVEFSHTYCPECTNREYAEYMDKPK